jgi:hypothetical protein
MRPRLTFANVVSVLALFVALGGTSYAAVQLSKGQVKKKHLAADAVVSKKVKDGSLLGKDFKPGELPAGAQGPAGPQGPAGLQGPQGPKGDAGSPGTTVFESTIPSGKTIRGSIGQQGVFTRLVGSFAVPAPAPLSDETVNFAPGAGSDADAACTGSATNPTAPRGKVCIYRGFASNIVSMGGYSDTSRYGFTIDLVPVTSGASTGLVATWAYTAP